ncbi:LysR family transcriptional regulator [Brytella acorum]|uniref:LysR family transcriptional regulator n=1 Tax=Brytella acorum TaxID=2959299 RepID=UPI0025AE992C|nr:LysR family transcriptional regulator [Brytella acorum]MDF3625958.1 LysR substrate-binding domain-containing protein [Brytella acorum]
MTEQDAAPESGTAPAPASPLSRDRLYRLLATGHIPLPALVQAIVVAEHLNLHRAAEALGVSQSAISTRLITLEETLGVQLFERRRYQRLRLTLHGRAFLDHVAPALAHIGRAVGTTDAGRDPRRDMLKVGLQSSIATGPLAALLRAFREAAPDVILRPEETPPQDALGEVRARKVDVLIAPDLLLAGSALHDTLESLPLWTEEMVVALPVDDPLAAQERVSWADLDGRTFLTRTDGISAALMEQARQHLDAAGIEPPIESLRIGRDTLMILVTLGLGVALTTQSAQGMTIEGLVFRPVGIEPVALRFLAVWSRYNVSPPLTTLLRLARRDHASP